MHQLMLSKLIRWCAAMTSAILIDNRSNAKQMQEFLSKKFDYGESIRVLEINDAQRDILFSKSIQYLFSSWNMPVLTAEDIKFTFPNLRALFYAGGDTRYFSGSFDKLAIPVFSAQSANAVPVAEFVLAQIILSNKGYYAAEDIYKRGVWRFAFDKARKRSRMHAGNYGSKVGIIGFGMIGSLVAKMLQSYEMEVLVHDPFVPLETINATGARSVGLTEIFSECDVITNHLPDLEQTRGILDYSLFSLMRSHATFINTGRGRQVVEAALVTAMREVPSRSALLDVTQHEPPFPFSTILRMRNIRLTPHIAGSQGAENERLYESIYQQFLRFNAIV